MGIRNAFKLAVSVANDAHAGEVLPFPRKIDGLASPWADSSGLAQALVANDIFDLPDLPLGRLEALTVPAVFKARAIFHSIIGPRPLRCYDRNGTLRPDQPAWLYRSDSGISPQQRTKATLDDFFFNEASLWVVKRGSEGQILDGVHLPYDRWRTNGEGHAEIDGVEVPDDQVIYFPAPGPGILVAAARSIRGSIAVDKAVIDRVANPIPLQVLHEVEDNGVTVEERDETLEAFRAARRSPGGSTGFLSAKFNLETYGEETVNLFESGRNAFRIDIANHFNLPASILDGSVAEASLTYSTQEGDRNEVFDYSVGYWAYPITDRLSLDDVTPRGTSVRFDFSDFLSPTASPTGPETED